MSTLHMETEVARATQTNLANSYTQVTQTITSVTSAVNGLQPAWMGNSATQFFSEYENWRSSMTSLLEQMNALSVRLNTEITEWEAAASNLG